MIITVQQSQRTNYQVLFIQYNKRWIYHLLPGILCLFVHRAFSQSTYSDSLIGELRKAKIKAPRNKKLQLNLLNQIGENLLKEGSPDALKYIRQALILSTQTNQKVDKLQSQFVMGLFYQKNDQPQQAIKHFKDVLKASKVEKTYARSAEVSLHLGNCYRSFNEIKSSLFHYFEAASFYRKIPDQAGYIEAINNVAGAFYDLGEYRNSLKYFLDVLKTAQRIKNIRLIAVAFNNVGSTYNILGSHDKAQEYLKKGLELVDQNKNLQRIKGALLSSLGEVFLLQKKYNKALEYFDQAWDIASKLQHQHLIIVVARDLAKVYVQQKDYTNALKYQQQSLVAAQTSKNLHEMQASYKFISAIYKESKDFENAFFYYDKYHQLRDSSDQRGQIEATRRMELRFQNTQKEQAIKLLTKEKQIQEAHFRHQKNLIYLGILIFLLVLIPSFIYYRHYKEKKHTRILFEERNKIIALQNEKIKAQTYHMERKHEEVQNKNHALITLNQEKNILVGMLAHDLRSPLNQLKGLIQLCLMTASTDDETTDYLQKAIQSTERLQTMIDRILDLKVVEEQELVVHSEYINLNLLLEEVIGNYQEQAHKKLIKIVLPYYDKSFEANLDRNFILQILENLLSNALKFSPPHKHIYINLSTQANKIRIAVKDEGPGISAEDQQKLFGKFQRLSAQPTGGENTVGLGLSIVKKFVEAMDGKIWCESVPGEGACFIVEFEQACA
ncbi:hypothetical protein BKI52_03070 [marine bacterium AO1-C]|nr:hypothetical protein BKI52_03070 [marine bacterium AO1-C]